MENQDAKRLERAMAAIVKLERQLEAAKTQMARLSGSYDLVRIADKDQTYDTIYYAEGSPELDPSYLPYLNQIADQLLAASKLNIRIEGHADAEESGGKQVELSKERARRIRDHFLARGVREKQIKWCGYGDRLQLFDPRTESGKTLNRRVELWPLVQWFFDSSYTPESEMAAFERYVNPWLGSLIRKASIGMAFASARGNTIVDTEGVEYLDFTMGCGVLPFGHNPPEIWRAIEEVRDQAMPQCIQPSMQVMAGKLAQRLLEICPPGFAKCVFGNSGTEAMEAAIKLCRAKSGRPSVLSTWNAFHGLTLGSLSSSGNAAYQKGYYAPVPSFDKVPFGDARALDEVLSAAPNRYAMFVVEPIQGPSGILAAPPGYLKACREICDKHGVFLVFDEIATGLGRTGDLFACMHDGVTPDVLVLSKALTGGEVPIGVAVYKDSVYSDQFAKTHASTLAMNSLACRVALESIDLVTANDQALVKHARELGARMRERLLAIRDKHPKILLDVRGRGLMIGLKFTDDREVWGAHSLMGAVADYGQLVAGIMGWLHKVPKIRVWVSMYSADVMRLTPALNVTWAECERMLAAIEEAVEIVAEGNIARLILEPHGYRLPPGFAMPKTPPVKWANPPLPGERRFAFLVHLADLDSYRDFDPSLRPLNDELVQKLADDVRLDPTPVNFFETRVHSATGITAHGSFCAIAYTADELKSMPRAESMALIRKALDLGREEDVEIVGLGGYTSVLTGSGLDLLDDKVPLTSGNAYTTVASHQAVCAAMDRLGRSLDTTMVVVGATGSIGGAISMLLGEVARDLILVGAPNRDAESSRRRLLEAGAKVCRHVALTHAAGGLERPGGLAARLSQLEQPSADAPIEDWIPVAAKALVVTQDIGAVLPGAEVVVTATSHPGAVVPLEKLRSGAVVCDVAIPGNVSKEAKVIRPDVLVIDGGVIAVPGARILGTKLEPNMSYACMAETMLLCLEGRPHDGTIGPNITIEKLNLVRDLAKKHGFTLAKLRSFGHPLTDEEWAAFQKRARPAQAPAAVEAAVPA